MRNTIKILSLICVLIIIVTGGFLIYNKASKSINTNSHQVQSVSEQNNSKNHNKEENIHKDEKPTEKYEAPDFKVKTNKGSSKTLSKVKGKPVVICFWASWDNDCKTQLNDFEKAYKKYGKNIEFMMINMTDGNRETLKTAKDFIKENKYSFPVYFDTDFSAAENYSVNTLPTSYFVTKKGVLMADAKGVIDFATIEKGIEMIK